MSQSNPTSDRRDMTCRYPTDRGSVTGWTPFIPLYVPPVIQGRPGLGQSAHFGTPGTDKGVRAKTAMVRASMGEFCRYDTSAVIVSDVQGEYESLFTSVGAELVALRRGACGRLDPPMMWVRDEMVSVATLSGLGTLIEGQR